MLAPLCRKRKFERGEEINKEIHLINFTPDTIRFPTAPAVMNRSWELL